MSNKTPAPDHISPSDEAPEYPLSAPIKPDDPQRRGEQSKAQADGCVDEKAVPAKDSHP
ncbi:hypothetical protein [Pseudomonas sp. LP_7_YM]|uniref:hypothetical protein n=1 Tax=Pseudomonas sp. LP_7_YM TaxID=2485137 RepID=UPI0010DC752B|nr:hypothetical protein [Pseudomonas sp. LP_7_YM]TDV72484.1 hypothetical protein EC915_101630 [Pseudomonas sp. LP_7_YM]